MTWPSSIGVGMQYKLSRKQRIGFDVDWQKWSSAFSSADITLSNPADPTLAALIGAGFTEAVPLRWNDAILVRSGYEQDFGKNQTFRCGYSFNSDPTVGATANNYLSSVLAHHFSLGYGWRSNGWSYDAAYQYAFRPTQHVDTSDLAGGDFSNSSISNTAHLFFAGATKRF
jgi:long-subunit fatty acid transport protein